MLLGGWLGTASARTSQWDAAPAARRIDARSPPHDLATRAQALADVPEKDRCHCPKGGPKPAKG